MRIDKDTILRLYANRIAFARVCRDMLRNGTINREHVPAPADQELIADMADSLEVGATIPSCRGCSFWKDAYPEADGKGTGTCSRHSRAEWRYDVVRNDGPFEFWTRSDFACNAFSAKGDA